MNFSKVKLVVCIGLLLVNIVFAFMTVRLVGNKNYISEDEVMLAQKHLAKNGITFSFDKQARRLYDLPIYSIEKSASDGIPAIYKRMTEVFFDEPTEESDYIKTPDGYSVSVKNEKGILVGTSSLLGGNRFECYREDAVGSREIREISMLPCVLALSKEKSERTDLALNYVEKALRGNGIRYTYCGEREYDNGSIVSFAAELSDTAVMNLYLNVYVKKSKIQCVIGCIAEGNAEKKYGCDIIDSIDILYMLRDEISEKINSLTVENIRINKIHMVYKLYGHSPTEDYLVPTWVIEYTDKNGEVEIVSMDAVTGKNTESL